MENGLHLGAWNIRTLNKSGVLKYVFEAYNMYKIDVLALQEIRWLNNGNVKMEKITLFYCGSNNGKHENGIGFMVHDKILPCIKNFSAVSDQIYYVQIVGRILT